LPHVAAHGHQLSLVVPAQVVLILHGNEPGPPAEIRGVLELCELPTAAEQMRKVNALCRFVEHVGDELLDRIGAGPSPGPGRRCTPPLGDTGRA